MSPTDSSEQTRLTALVRGQAGFTIVEVLVAIIVLVIGILGALALINTANATTVANKARTGGVNLAREVADGSRAIQETVSYSQLSDGCPEPSSPGNPCPTSSPIVAALQAQPGLAPAASSPPGEWTIEREDITYNVTVSVCALDEPSDGFGSHATDGPFCADVAAAGTTDREPDDYRRLIVDVTWAGTRGSQETRAVALLQSDGVNGPAVTCLRPTSSPCPATTTPLVLTGTTLQFTATTSGPVQRLVWYVDGAFKGTVTPTGGTATFTWDLGTSGSAGSVFDGTYEISAAAFDVNGKSGTTGSVSVQVNRRAPVAPGGFVAGRNTMIGGNANIGGVDLDWLPVPDQDVLYYRIYRKVGTANAALLATTSGSSITSYTDRNAPANPSVWVAPCVTRLPAASDLRYYVVAVDQNGASPRQGAQTASVEVNACNTPPKNPPDGTLTLTENANGTNTLAGALPAVPTDLDVDDSVVAVRIYRWSETATPSDTSDRLEFLPVNAGATGFSFTDPAPEPEGVEQKYCFTNVDSRMQESICSNVVTG